MKPTAETVAKPEQRTAGQSAQRLIAAIIVVAVVALAWRQSGDQLSVAALAERETQLREWRSQQPWLVALLGLAVYVLVTGLSLPGAALLTLACGWYYGFWQGLLIVSLGSTAGATLSFLSSRFLLRGYVQDRFGTQLQTVNDALQREGAYYLLTLRLIPAVPFFVVNLLMGLTHIPTATFWWASQLGMLPGTAAYVSAGASVPSLKTIAEQGVRGILSPQMLAAFAVLGLLPLILKALLGRLRPAAQVTNPTEGPA